MARKRLRRPATARQGPVRNPVVRGSADALRSLVDGGVDAARDVTEASSATMQGAVEDTVATAYALSEQLMNRGYSAAGLYSRSTGDPTMSDASFRDAGPYARPGSGRPGSDRGSGPWGSGGPMGMWMEPWLQMMRMWTDSLYMLSSSANPMNPMNPLSSAMGMGGNPGVSVEVQSLRPTRVTLDLAPGADFEQLSVGPLTALSDPSADMLEGVSISARPGQYSVHIEVSDLQAPGVYVGTVEGSRHRVLGELRVEVIGSAKKPRKKAAAKRKSAPAKKGGRRPSKKS